MSHQNRVVDYNYEESPPKEHRLNPKDSHPEQNSKELYSKNQTSLKHIK